MNKRVAIASKRCPVAEVAQCLVVLHLSHAYRQGHDESVFVVKAHGSQGFVYVVQFVAIALVGPMVVSMGSEDVVVATGIVNTVKQVLHIPEYQSLTPLRVAFRESCRHCAQK